MSIDFAALGTPRPDVQDRDLAGFWEGASAGELRVPRSRTTQEYVWPPRPSSVGRPDFDLEWTTVPSTGELFTWTTVGQTGLSGFCELTPYVVAVVQLDDVPVRMVGFSTVRAAQVRPGLRMRAAFQPLGEGAYMLTWEAAD